METSSNYQLDTLWKITQASDGSITPNNNDSAGVSEWDRYRQIHPFVTRWATPWGGIWAWSESFEAIFHAACFRGERATSQLLRRLWGHAEVGKQLLDLLRSTNLPLGDEEDIQLLWIRKTQDIEFLVHRITIIETRHDIIWKTIFTVEGRPYGEESESDRDLDMLDEESRRVRCDE